MSRISQKSTKSNRSSVRDGGKPKNYKVYAIKFHGTGLEAIRLQFKKCVQSGLRRTVYVIDLDEELEHTLSARREVQKKPSRGPSMSRMQDLNTLVINAIERCRRHYQMVMNTLELERQFDLLKYWQDELDAQTVATRLTKRRSQLAPKTAGTLPQTALAPGGTGATNRGQRKTAGRRTLEKRPSIVDTLANCMEVKRKSHNTVGAPEVLSKRKYINDEPPDTKLFIILIGNLTIQLYIDLLRRNEPLQAIIDFLPEMNAYDLMIPHPQVHEFIVNTFGQIHWGIEEFRKAAITKPVGVFHQQLPVISTCLAEKYASEIYAQLTWYVYDVEVLFQQYLDYYVKPYHEVNVAMDKAVQLQNLQETAESLSIQGHYLKSSLPACAVDPATIYMYWDSLLSVFQQPIRLLTSDEAFMLTQPSKVSICYAEVHSDSNLLYVLQAYQNAFNSITKIKRFERIFVEHNNELLGSLIGYCDQKIYLNVYNACLEYNLLRQYLHTGYTRGSMDYHAYSNTFEPIYLPRYAKFHPTGDGVNQKLASLVDTYDSYGVEEIYPGYMLYTFHRTYNEIFDNEKLTLVPTKLCFRDFTIYQKDEFLGALVTPEMRRLEHEAALTVEEHVRRTLKNEHIEFDGSIFVRPSSLKARLAAMVRLSQSTERLRDSPSKLSRRNIGSQRDSKRRTGMQTKESVLFKESLTDYVGLPPKHPLLYGYNLENVRQEIFTRISKYHFEEGMLKLYEERWNNVAMNAHVELSLLGNSLTIKRHRRQPLAISKDLRLVSKNNISMRLKTAADQCSKVVINYPNGLTASHEGSTVRQVWSLTETHNDEHLRIYTPHGAVIIFLNGNDVITVLRYNGEMYQLLQYELISEEEEGGGEEEDTGGLAEGSERSAELPETVAAAATKVPRSKGGGKRKSKSSSSLSAETGVEPPAKTAKQKLADSISGEYTFIQQIMGLYNLSYLHLRIITSSGRVVNITHKGKIYQTHENHLSEWQDYARNECYALRDDGLKMVWTEDCLRCYHIDGTVMVSYLREESWELSDFEFPITPSSSHLSEHSESQDQLTQPEATYVEADSSIHSGGGNDYIKYLNRDAEEGTEKDTSYLTYHLDMYGLYNEHYVAVLIKPCKCNLHVCDELDVRIKLMAVDDIAIELMAEEPPPPLPPRPSSPQPPLEHMLSSRDSLRNTRPSIRQSTTRLQRAPSASGGRAPSAPRITYDKLYASSSLDQLLYTTEPPPTRYQIVATIGQDFMVELHDDYFQVVAKVERAVCDEEMQMEEQTVEEQCVELSEEQSVEGEAEEWGEEEGEEAGEQMSDKLVLRVEYDKDVIPNLFHSFVEKIAQLKNCPGPKQDTFYFLEKRNPDCCYQGFELFDELPPTTGQVYHISNTVTELNTLKTMNDRMLLPYEHYLKDMKKFPRFHKRPPLPQPKKKLYENYPVVTSVTLYLKIPRPLANTEDILKFIAPLDETTFKRTRRVIKRALDHFLRPEIELSVCILQSHKNWERRLLQHRRRLFTIDQRRGLYEAMLKHKNYPKYQHFVQDFSGHAKYIDFFDFMKYSCMDKELSSGDRPSLQPQPAPPAEPDVIEVERKPRVQYMT